MRINVENVDEPLSAMQQSSGIESSCVFKRTATNAGRALLFDSCLGPPYLVSEFVGRFPYRSLVYYACAPLFIENSFNHSRNPLRLKRLLNLGDITRLRWSWLAKLKVACNKSSFSAD